MNNGLKGVLAVACLGVIAFAGYNYMQAKKAERKLAALQELSAATAAEAAQEEIWIGLDECKTTFGPNTIAFCDGVSKDDSLFLDAGADAAVKACFEYTAEKLGRPALQAQDIACEVKEAFQGRDYEYNSEEEIPGIYNNNYNILNYWVNQ